MNKKIRKSILIAIFLIIGVLFVSRYAGPAILKTYIEFAMGSCKKIPVFCIVPDEDAGSIAVNPEYISSLMEYNLPEIQIFLPKGFKVIKQKVSKNYYKKWRQKTKGAVVYLLYEPKDFFIRLFPELRQYSVNNDADFISRIMYSRMDRINNLRDAFFMVMKGIFIPDLADQHNVHIARYLRGNETGFIAYNIGEKENYFNCDIVNDQGYFKVYIKDKTKLLDLAKVVSVISTIKKIEGAL